MSEAFDQPLSICGEFRRPRQMLADQSYDGHLSLHDDKMAQDLGFRAGPIEGPTHFSQFIPLLHHIFGNAWFERGCISAHYQSMVVEGEEVRAFAELSKKAAPIHIWAEKRDGTTVLTGTASVGPEYGETEIAKRLAALRPASQLVIMRDLNVGQKGASPEQVRMGFDQHMGNQYPFSLNDKLKVITEPSPWYTSAGGAASPWGRAIIPFEMISVLLGYTSGRAGFRTRGPAVGLFAAQEIKLIKGPLFVDHPYDLEREIIALSESKRTESNWVRTKVYETKTRELIAEMILNGATLKNSYAKYDEEAKALGKHP
ncbi:MAG TPA: hypothetical protein VMA09_17985 [Candidatus Binataceae bacterium]|nr:hypothetical protein [Candidatus Binataceae bacterium]